MKRLLIICITLFALYSCGDDDKHTVQKEKIKKELPNLIHKRQDLYYKRLTGTLGDTKIVLHLHRYSGNAYGIYYNEQGDMQELYSWDDTTNDNILTLTEVVNNTDENSQPARWTLIVEDHKATGSWVSGDSLLSRNISLTEEYPAGSYPLGIYSVADTIPYTEGREQPFAYFAQQLVYPAKTITREGHLFLWMQIKKIVGCSDTARILAKCITDNKDEYYSEYKDMLSGLDLNDTTIPAYTANHSLATNLYVNYNDNGWLVLQQFTTTYTGGAHGNYGASYYCLDMQQYKKWLLKDVIKIDSLQLQNMLERKARDYFNLAGNQNLDNYLLVEHIPPTDNFFITDKGLTFVYNPYEIAPYAAGLVELYIPYTELQNLLTSEFKKRMKLIAA